MKPAVLSAMALTVLVSTTSCVTVYEPLPLRKERSYSAVISHSDVFTPGRGQSFAWYTNKVIDSGNGVSVKIPAQTHERIAQLIETHLIAQGFRLVADANEADFMIGAGLLINRDDQNEAMLDFIEVFPAVRETLTSDHPVSLLVAAGKPAHLKEHHMMWRGVVNATVATTNIAETEREAEAEKLVRALLTQFP